MKKFINSGQFKKGHSYGFKKGQVPWNKGSKGLQVAWNKGIGNKSTIAQKIRSSLEYEEWRKSVFERDKYTCQHCLQVGGYLNADHIKPFSQFPELRFELSNGRTLCVGCHRKTDTFGSKIRNGATSKWRAIASA